jgi:hypothetical protein
MYNLVSIPLVLIYHPAKQFTQNYHLPQSEYNPVSLAVNYSRNVITRYHY